MVQKHNKEALFSMPKSQPISNKAWGPALFWVAAIHVATLSILITALFSKYVTAHNLFFFEIPFATIISALIFALVFRRRQKLFTKKLKSLGDMIWNTWSLLAVCSLFFYISLTGAGISGFLADLGPVGSSVAVAIVVPSAAIKVSVSVLEALIEFGHVREQA